MNERRERSDWSETGWCVYGERMRRLLKLVRWTLNVNVNLDWAGLALGALLG
jgi:hypothetical protein